MSPRRTEAELWVYRDLAMEDFRREARERGEPDPIGEEVAPYWLRIQIEAVKRRRAKR